MIFELLNRENEMSLTRFFLLFNPLFCHSGYMVKMSLNLTSHSEQSDNIRSIQAAVNMFSRIKVLSLKQYQFLFKLIALMVVGAIQSLVLSWPEWISPAQIYLIICKEKLTNCIVVHFCSLMQKLICQWKKIKNMLLFA